MATNMFSDGIWDWFLRCKSLLRAYFESLVGMIIWFWPKGDGTCFMDMFGPSFCNNPGSPTPSSSLCPRFIPLSEIFSHKLNKPAFLTCACVLYLSIAYNITIIITSHTHVQSHIHTQACNNYIYSMIYTRAVYQYACSYWYVCP
jgi:hypothetical protein